MKDVLSAGERIDIRMVNLGEATGVVIAVNSAAIRFKSVGYRESICVIPWSAIVSIEVLIGNA